MQAEPCACSAQAEGTGGGLLANHDQDVPGRWRRCAPRTHSTGMLTPASAVCGLHDEHLAAMSRRCSLLGRLCCRPQSGACPSRLTLIAALATDLWRFCHCAYQGQQCPCVGLLSFHASDSHVMCITEHWQCYRPPASYVDWTLAQCCRAWQCNLVRLPSMYLTCIVVLVRQRACQAACRAAACRAAACRARVAQAALPPSRRWTRCALAS